MREALAAIAERLLFCAADVVGWLAHRVVGMELWLGDLARKAMLRRLRRSIAWRGWAAEYGAEQADTWILMHEIASAWLAKQKDASDA